MNFISTNNLTTINFELTDFCNAACPMCVRHDWNGNLKKESTNKNHTTLNFIKEKIGTNLIAKLKTIMSCGTYGDAIMNPECLQIYEYFRKNNKNRIELYTNGGTRSKEFWTELAKLGITVIFSIDGLADTNHLYRRKVKWDKLYENVNTYLSNGGEARWEFLIFKHNEHQIETARELSKQLGFYAFTPKHTGRWKDFNDQGEYRDTDKIAVENYFLEKPNSQTDPNKIKNVRPLRYYKDKELNYQKIECASCNKNNIEIYIRANGYVSPCCWLGDVKIHEAKRLIKNYDEIDLNKSDLDTILNGDFFKKLSEGIYNDQSLHRLQTCFSCCGIN